MHQLDDSLLVESYKKAIKININDDFIKLLEQEMIRREMKEFIVERRK